MPAGRRNSILLLLVCPILSEVACTDGGPQDCGPNPCGACQQGCPDRCTPSGWQCCACADSGARPREAGSGPGRCFEVFAEMSAPGTGQTPLPGISHSPPRQGDLGKVAVGQQATARVRFYNFCDDQQSVVVDTRFLEPAPAFAITQQPEVGSRLGSEQVVVVRFAPTQPGIQTAAVRYEVSHGYYDFSLAGEGVAP